MIAILSLALGIGANTAMFQLLDAVRMRTIRVKDPQELAFVHISDRSWNSRRFTAPALLLTQKVEEASG